MPSLLVIDDDPLILECFRHAFPEPAVTLLLATSAGEGLKLYDAHRPDVVIIDVGLPDMSGLDLFRQLNQRSSKVPVIVVTGLGTAQRAIEAMRLGAYDYVVKPLGLDQLTELVNRAFEISRLMRVPAVLPDSEAATDSADVLIGQSLAMQEVYKAIGRVAPRDVTVLIVGESGTGKEMVARAIYHYSQRSSGPFLAINCAAIPEALLESELFGHEKGAFTGADRRRIGKFEQCSGGTLFLDEIGDMTPLTQTKVLRVLQDQQFERVGGNETIRTDVRIIAATNRNLEQLMSEGRFRSDLYYRLNVYSVRLKPLRERLDDLPGLVQHFLKRFGAELGKEIHTISPGSMDQLTSYPWPGNVRELQSVIKQAILQSTGPVLMPEAIPPEIRGEETPADGSGAGPSDLMRFVQERLQAGSDDLHAETLAWVERQLFGEVLRHTGGNLSHAARILGIARPTLRSRLGALGISIERITALEESSAPLS